VSGMQIRDGVWHSECCSNEDWMQYPPRGSAAWKNRIRQVEVNKRQAVADYDLQARCSKDAKQCFKDGWSSTKDTIMLDYTNHYNKGLNKCFILVEHHFSFGTHGSWINAMTLYDVYENVEYGSTGEYHMIFSSPDC
jgi:hypothetical protein